MKKLKKLNLVKCDDYLTWLHNFANFHLIPLYLKMGEKYEQYLVELNAYLCQFFRKTQVLVDWNKIEEQNKDTFKEEWE